MKARKTLFALILAAITALVVGACALAACKPNKLESVYIESSNMPQTIFVVGNELDLSAGKLTAKYTKGTKEIALDATEISVDGYDKDKLGEQELTIGYGGKSTSLTVTTVERMVVNNLTKKYFVGDELDKEGASVTITQDNGTRNTLSLGSSEIRVTGFNSEKEGEVQLTVTYNGYSATYSTTVSVNVYEVADVVLHKPSKTQYLSHESLDVSGASLELKNADGSLTRSITVTESMISGFDLSVATKDNTTVETAATQTLTVSYSDYEKTFDITIIFSSVSIIRLTVEELSAYDWSNKDFMVTSEDGEAATAAIELYYTLSNSEKQLITYNQRAALSRVATIYCYKDWQDALAQYKDVFTIEAVDGNATLVPLGNYIDTKAAYEDLQNDEHPIYQCTGLLSKMASDTGFSMIELFTGSGISIGSYLSAVPSADYFKAVFLPEMNYMLRIYEAVQSVPDDWKEMDPDDFATSAIRAYNVMYNNLQQTNSVYDRSIHGVISSWRANDDLFDIIYTYYLNVGNNAEYNLLVLANFFYLPGNLEELYEYMYSSYVYFYYMDNGYVLDSTYFMMFYKKAVQVRGRIEEENDALHNEILDKVGFVNFFVDAETGGYPTADVILDELLYGTVGYYYNVKSMLGVTEFDSVWGSYLYLFDILDDFDLDDDNFDSVYEQLDFIGAMEQLIGKYAALTPVQRMVFLQSLNVAYGEDTVMFAPENVKGNQFTSIVDGYYKAVLTPAAYAVYSDVMLALESHARRAFGYQTYSMAQFSNSASAAVSAYGALGGEDKQSFDSCAKVLYDKCVEIASMYDSEGTFNKTLSSDEQAALGELQDLIYGLDDVILLFEGESADYYFGALYANYEAVYAKLSEILGNASYTSLIAEYYYGDTEFDDGSIINLEYYMMFISRSYYVGYLTAQYVYWQGETVMLYDVYDSSSIKSYLADAAYVMNISLGYNTDDSFVLDVDIAKVLSIMNSFDDLTLDQKVLFLYIDQMTESYNEGLFIALASELGWDLDTSEDVIHKLLTLNSYCILFNEGNAYHLIDKAMVINAANSLKDKYAALDPSDKDAFDSLLGETYQGVLEYYEGLM